MIITVLRKSLEGTAAENTLKHGCGALNIDATRVEGEPWKWGTQTDIKGGGFGSKRPSDGNILRKNVEGGFNGRWPANFILTHQEGCESQDEDWVCVEGCSVKELDQQSGEVKSGGRSSKNYADRDSDRLVYGGFSGVAKEIQPSSGGASRFFKQFKKGNN